MNTHDRYWGRRDFKTLSRTSDHIDRRQGGFTLLELVLAMLISSLVVGILSVSLSFTLRTWERHQQRKANPMAGMIDLLKWQLATFDPVQVSLEGKSSLLFAGDQHSLTLATDHSIKAISKGMPVIARYVFIAEEQKLYYAEMPLDPYHPEAIQAFFELQPEQKDPSKAWPRFYTTAAAEFSVSYGAAEGEEYLESWEMDTLPIMVQVKWSGIEDASESVALLVPNLLFPRKTDTQQGIDENGGSFDNKTRRPPVTQ